MDTLYTVPSLTIVSHCLPTAHHLLATHLAPPPAPPLALYLLYAKLEEEHGLARHAMAVYDRATRAVPPGEQLDMFCVYLKQAADVFGITYTREIYEKAIEQLPDEGARWGT